MQKQKCTKKRNWLICFLSVLLLLLITAVPLSVTSVRAASPVTKKAAYIGYNTTLKINGKTRAGKWNSSKKNIATVSNKGVVTPKKRGKTTITATIGKKNYKFIITVKQPVKSITMNKYGMDLGVDESEKLIVKVYPGSADNKKLIWKSSDPNVAKVSSNGTVTATGNGYCNIWAIAADRKKVKQSCTVHVDNNKIYKTKYSYEVFLIDGLGNDAWYNGVYRTIYIKTDNPNPESLNWETTQSVCRMFGDASEFDDVTYTGKTNINGFGIVDGGYLLQFGLENDDNRLFGNYGGIGTINIMENDWTVASFSCKFKDYDTEQNKMLDYVIEQATTSDMTPFEKMQAVCDYFTKIKHVRYLPNDGKYLMNLATDPIDPWWLSWRFDSLRTPNTLYKIAQKIGGFDKIENDYSKYYDTPEWGSKHWYVEVTIGNDTRKYSFCPMTSTGTMTSTSKINFKDTSKFIKLF